MNYMEHYERWLNEAVIDDETKAEIRGLDKDEIEDRFYKTLEFGTGGLRGIMGAGTNRMNKYVIRQVTQGLAREILSYGEDFKKSGVVIAHDSRNNSAEFAMESAKVLSANGIKTYLFDSLRPTPELSFAVRHLGCARGIVVTASHNPKEYNGFKVYGEDGGQLPPASADKIIDYINEIDIFNDVKYTDLPDIITIGEDVDRAYVDAVKAQSMGVNISDDFKVVYTPIHGSGNLLVRRVLDEIGVKNVFVVPEQEKPDGNFPTVISPNPENSEAFTIAIKYAKEQNADIIFGTDPDSDRIGVVVRNAEGEYVVLNGNQTGSLLCEYILRKSQEKGALNGKRTIIKTIVTTEMVRAIADSFGVETMDVLTGLKFIGEKIKEFEAANEPDRFVFGFEESYGCLKGTYARDKYAVVAAMLVCEMAADYKAQGMTLYDGLVKLYEKYGFYLEGLKTITLTGIAGTEKIKEIMDTMRKNAPSEICGFKVKEMRDYELGIDGLPKSNVLKFIFEDAWFAIRPSGTEPKIKLYAGVKSDSIEKSKEMLNELLSYEV